MTELHENARRAVPTFEVRPPVKPPAARSLADLGPRAVSGAVLVAVALIGAKVGGVLFALLWLAAAGCILMEWQRMVAGPRVLLRFGVGLVALAAAALLLMVDATDLAAACLLLGAVAAAGFAQSGRRLVSACGVIYAGATLGSILLLRNSGPWPVSAEDDLGYDAVLWIYAVVWTHDMAAYFGGRLIGGPKLWPSISPGKTWAGTLAGVVCGALAGAAMAPVVGSALPCLILGLLCAVAAGAGDMFESALKRRFGVKDSGHMIPGHGGAMDRLDGFAAAVFLATLVGVSRHGFDFAAVGLFYW